MGFLRKERDVTEFGNTPPYYPMEPEVSTISPDVWREAQIDESNTEAVLRRDELREGIFAVFFGEVDKDGQRPRLPFGELPTEAIASMSLDLRQAYEAELAAAQDSRSGRVVQPYIPPGIVEEPPIN